MKNNRNISNKDKYFSEEILIKYLKGELSIEESENLKYLIDNDNVLADIYEGLKLLNSPDEILFQKENLNKKIDAFSKNKLKNIIHKYFVIRQILLFAIVVLTIVGSSLFIKKNIQKEKQQQACYDDKNNLISDEYDNILFLSDNKQFIKEIVIKGQKEIKIEKYIVEDNKKEIENKGNKKLLKNNEMNIVDIKYFVNKHNNFIPAEYSEGDSIYFQYLKNELYNINKLKPFIVILTISDSGDLTSVEDYVNNNIEKELIKNIFQNRRKWIASKKNGIHIKSKIAIKIEK